MSPRRVVRVATGDAMNSYPRQTRLDSRCPCPTGPWAVYLADEAGRFWLIGLDFDAHDRPASQAQRDAARVSGLLTDAKITHLVCESGPSGGRHIWISLSQSAAPRLVRDLAHSLSAIAPTFDPTPLLNPASGCLRPPGAPHRHGGTSRPVAGDLTILTCPTTTPTHLIALVSHLNSLTSVQTPCELPTPSTELPRDVDGRVWLPGPRRILPPASQAALTEDGTTSPDASRLAWIICLGAAASSWHYSDLAALIDTKPGLEHLRTQRSRRSGVQRLPRPAHGPQSPHEALGRMWAYACRWVATHPRQQGVDPSFDPRAHAVAAHVDAVQSRADAAPGRWQHGGGPADRRVLDALCLLALQGVTTNIEADIRRLALLAGVGRETARTALLRLSADEWISQQTPSAGRHAATWQIGPSQVIHSCVDDTRPQAYARPLGAGTCWRTLLTHTLDARLTLARHDIFTGPRSLGLAAGNVYARLRQLVPPPNQLARLADAGLIMLTPTGWQRGPQQRRDTLATALGVTGRLKTREQRYARERELWEWWLTELDWMRAPGRHKRRRKPNAQLALILGRSWDAWPAYPRLGRRPDHHEAMRQLSDGSLDHLRHQRLAAA